jgi:hypothetical protein
MRDLVTGMSWACLVESAHPSSRSSRYKAAAGALLHPSARILPEIVSSNTIFTLLVLAFVHPLPLRASPQEENSNGMELREGSGNEFKGFGQPTEDDLMNVVWVVDSNNLPFYRVRGWRDGWGTSQWTRGTEAVLAPFPSSLTALSCCRRSSTTSFTTE